MVTLLESSKITMQVTNHFRYMENTQPHMVVLNLFFQPINTYFLFTGILITLTGIFNKNSTETGILEKFLVGNGIVTPPSRPSLLCRDYLEYQKSHCLKQSTLFEIKENKKRINFYSVNQNRYLFSSMTQYREQMAML